MNVAVCLCCSETKPVTQFRTRKGRRPTMCKTCRNARTRGEYLANPRKFVGRKNKYRRENWVQYALGGAKLNAKRKADKKGIPFSLTSIDIKALAVDSDGVCALSGLPFRPTVVKGCKGPYSPSLDRVRPELGYVPGNVRIVLDCLNSAKGSGTDDDLIAICKAVAERH